jgi:hypothetical protein
MFLDFPELRIKNPSQGQGQITDLDQHCPASASRTSQDDIPRCRLVQGQGERQGTSGLSTEAVIDRGLWFIVQASNQPQAIEEGTTRQELGQIGAY